MYKVHELEVPQTAPTVKGGVATNTTGEACIVPNEGRKQHIPYTANSAGRFTVSEQIANAMKPLVNRSESDIKTYEGGRP